jgi:transposase
MEACVAAHHFIRKLQALGHDDRLMPAKYVRPYSKKTEERFPRDAEAIIKAMQRPTMKLSPPRWPTLCRTRFGFVGKEDHIIKSEPPEQMIEKAN